MTRVFALLFSSFLCKHSSSPLHLHNFFEVALSTSTFCQFSLPCCFHHQVFIIISDQYRYIAVIFSRSFPLHLFPPSLSSYFFCAVHFCHTLLTNIPCPSFFDVFLFQFWYQSLLLALHSSLASCHCLSVTMFLLLPFSRRFIPLRLFLAVFFLVIASPYLFLCFIPLLFLLKIILLASCLDVSFCCLFIAVKSFTCSFQQRFFAADCSSLFVTFALYLPLCCLYNPCYVYWLLFTRCSIFVAVVLRSVYDCRLVAPTLPLSIRYF